MTPILQVDNYASGRCEITGNQTAIAALTKSLASIGPDVEVNRPGCSCNGVANSKAAHEPLGLPVWDFEPPASAGSQAAMVHNRPDDNRSDDKPTPLGLPVMQF